MFNKQVFVYIAVFMPIVIAWTIDLPEIRRHLFKNNEETRNDNFGVQGEFFYDNVEGNSKHNSKEYKMYANNLEYQHDVQQRVARIAQDGGRYLEGLRRSIENYIEFVKGCTNMTFSLSLNSTSNSTWLPQLEASDIVSDGVRSLATCAEVTRVGEHARRLAELAMWATRRLQDLAYAEMYQKDVSEEEDELIFRLASFLDGLARLTGFRPNPKQFLTDPPVSK
ncbi:hypothetical protein O3G_MSEX008308 [Manduca sexta]|uniref:Uncharacterized protein n=1 Tax=Manduca sexta TaxID=7130 RepID=A0A922CPK8_MANSE|nr:hypothetical protein O3G_MSEX008308 [Manduca sexta]